MKINGFIFLGVGLFFLTKPLAQTQAQTRPVQIVLGGNQLVEIQNPTRLQNQSAVQRFNFEKHPFVQNLEKSIGERRTWRTQSPQDQSIASCTRQSVLRDMSTNQRQVHSVESYAVLCASYPSSSQAGRPFEGSYAIFPRERQKGTGAQKTNETLEVVNLVSSPFSNELRAHFSGQQVAGQSSRALSQEERELFAGQCSPADGFKSKTCEMFKNICPNGICTVNSCPGGKVSAQDMDRFLRHKYNIKPTTGLGLGFPGAGGAGLGGAGSMGAMIPGGVQTGATAGTGINLAPLSGLMASLGTCPQTPGFGQANASSSSSVSQQRLPSRDQLRLELGLQMTNEEYQVLASGISDPLSNPYQSEHCFSCPRGTTFAAPNLCKDRNGCDVLTEELRGGVCRVKDCQGSNIAHCSDRQHAKTNAVWL